ncbi:MAG: hypothetical protein ACUVXA_14675 [Candidatus Jordarchaeum sp.]|uniref:hypothetical protein n=1 Tax=Candidatus Jordarchaeum sp. TaxID=2823881 RepID=UPI00404B3011
MAGLPKLEWNVYDLEQDYRELKAADTVSQSRIKTIEDEIEKLRTRIEKLKNEASRKVPVLKRKVEWFIKRLVANTKRE